MDLFTAMTTRRSIRSYQPDSAIKPEIVEQILNAAMYAPSAMNKRPWEFIVTQNPKHLKAIEQTHPHAGFLTQAGTAILICANTSVSYQNYWQVDPLLAGQNILLAAQALDLGTCWCGVYPQEDNMIAFTKLFNLPPQLKPMALIVLGKPQSVPEKPLDRFEKDKIHWVE